MKLLQRINIAKYLIILNIQQHHSVHIFHSPGSMKHHLDGSFRNQEKAFKRGSDLCFHKRS